MDDKELFDLIKDTQLPSQSLNELMDTMMECLTDEEIAMLSKEEE